MSKRTTAAVTFAVGCILGGFIGFVWHAPGRPSTWTDARGWATFAVVVLGFLVAGYELDLQRRQFASEAKRNEPRDALLDGQLRELGQVTRLRERAQAEGVDLDWTREDDGGSFVRVINESLRPIRYIACRAESRDDPAVLVRPDRAAELVNFYSPASHDQWVMLPDQDSPDGVVVMIKSDGRAGFLFTTVGQDEEANRVMARYTDDAGLHWELDNDLHLVRLDNRDDW